MKGAKYMEMSYREVDGLLFPELEIQGQIDEPLTKYGLMKKGFLEQHHPIRFNQMIMGGTLYPHCKEVERKMQERMHRQIEQMKKQTSKNLWPMHITEIESELVRELILTR
jgi:hypothetical protein